MTALKPIENTTRVRGVPSKRYWLNETCSMPECGERADSAHHIFGRPPGPDSDSWFVEIPTDRSDPLAPMPVQEPGTVIPHVTGLCGSGTTGHHGGIEEHRAWIKFEDGVYVWYERMSAEETAAERARWSETTGEHEMSYPTDDDVWKRLGALNPQPGSREGKTKKAKSKRRTLDEQERRVRVNVTVKVPKDAEDGAGLWDDTLEEIKAALRQDGLYGPEAKIPQYEAWMAAGRDWLDRRKTLAS